MSLSPIRKRPAHKAHPSPSKVQPSKSYRSPAPPRYVPSKTVLSLPEYFDVNQKAFFNQYIGEPFLEQKAKRGVRHKNAMSWVYDIFTNDFLKATYPNHDLTDADKQWYWRKIGGAVYTYLYNHTKRSSNGVIAKVVQPKSRAYAHDFWRRENMEAYQMAVAAYIEGHPDEAVDGALSFGKMRSVSTAAFKLLPKETQDKWRKIAKDDLATVRALQRLGDTDARARYIKNFFKALDTLLKEGESVAGIKLVAVALSEKPNGGYQISRHSAEGVGDLLKATSLIQFCGTMKEWFESQTEGGQVVNGAPKPTVYPDYSRSKFPRLPEFAGLHLVELQVILRLYMAGLWQYQGGARRVPWAKITLNRDKYIHQARLPPGAVVKDPGSLTIVEVLVLLNYFLLCQEEQIPLDKTFQYLAVEVADPIEPTESEETKRELIEDATKGKTYWLVTYEDTVTKCHASKGMVHYTEEQIRYAHFVATGQEESSVPDEWNSLPFGDDITTHAVFVAKEKAQVLALANQLPQLNKQRAYNLVNLTNEHQSHFPASDSLGLWGLELTPPSIIPAAPPSSTETDYFNTMWPPREYFQSPSSSPPEGCFSYIEDWQKFVVERDSKGAFHEPSGTFMGGETGIGWLSRPLLKFLFAFSALRGDFAPSEELPSDYDKSRLPLGEWDRLLGWIDELILVLREDIAILSRTSGERAKGLLHTIPDHSSDEEPTVQPLASTFSAHSDPVPTGSTSISAHDSRVSTPESTFQAPRPTGSPSATQSCTPTEKPKQNPKAKSTAAAKKSRKPTLPPVAFHAESGPPSPESEEVDYDTLDKTSQDDEDDSFDLFNLSRQQDSTPCESPRASVSAKEKSPAGIDDTAVGTATSQAFDVNIRAIWLPVEHVFGTACPLPLLKPELYKVKSFNEAGSKLKNLDTHAKSLIKQWRSFASEHMHSPEPSAHVCVSTFSPAQKPLVKYLLNRQHAWKLAENLAPSVFNFIFHFKSLIRESVYTYGSIERTIELKRYMSAAESDLEAVEARLAESRFVISQLRLYCDELSIFHSLATEWYNRLEGTWLHEDVPSKTANLLELAKAQMLWTHRTVARRGVCTVNREKTSSKLPPGEGLVDIWYTFGCPQVSDEPSSLRGLLSLTPAPPQPSNEMGARDLSANGITSDPVPLNKTPEVPVSSALQGHSTLEQDSESSDFVIEREIHVDIQNPALGSPGSESESDLPGATINDLVSLTSSALAPSLGRDGVGMSTLAEQTTPVADPPVLPTAPPVNTSLATSTATATATATANVAIVTSGGCPAGGTSVNTTKDSSAAKGASTAPTNTAPSATAIPSPTPPGDIEESTESSTVMPTVTGPSSTSIEDQTTDNHDTPPKKAPRKSKAKPAPFENAMPEVAGKRTRSASKRALEAKEAEAASAGRGKRRR